MLLGYRDLTGKELTFAQIEAGEGTWQRMEDGIAVGVPAWMARGIALKDGYKRYADYSATELIDEPRRVILKQRCDWFDDLPFWAAFGTIGHAMFAKGVKEDGTSEKSFTVEVHGKMVGGKLDYFDENELSDIKTTSAYQVRMAVNEMKSEWTAQFSIYRWLLFMHGHTKISDTATVNLFVRDWRGFEHRDYLVGVAKAKAGTKYKTGAKAGQPYAMPAYVPSIPCLMLPVPLWTVEATEKFVYDKVAQLEAMKAEPIESLPPCAEVWRDKRTGIAKRCTQYCPFGRSGDCAVGAKEVAKADGTNDEG